MTAAPFFGATAKSPDFLGFETWLTIIARASLTNLSSKLSHATKVPSLLCS